MAKRKEYTIEETEFIKTNYPTKGGAWCANNLNKKDYNVTNFAKRLGLIYVKPPNIDLDMMNPIIDKNLIYLLGFWWADASLNKKTLSLEISGTDGADIMEVYKKICDFSLYHRPKRGNDKQTITFLLNQKSFCSILIDYDYNIKSSSEPIKILNNIPEKYRYLWWRGFFDGDGHVKVCKKGRYGFNMSGNVSLSWESTTNLLDRLEINYRLQRYSNTKSKYSDINCQNKDGFIKFFNYIYQNRMIDGIGLTRKYDKFKDGLLQIKKFEESSCQGRLSISVSDINGNFIKSFRSMKDASKFLDIDVTRIYPLRKKGINNIDDKWIITYNN